MPDKRILLVEDELVIQELLANTLNDEGYLVDRTATIGDAWSYLDAHAYALVISDWRLPDGDGTLIADAAAALGAKAMVMSGYLVQMPGGRCDQHETLMKPFRPSELLAAVEHAIGKAGND